MTIQKINNPGRFSASFLFAAALAAILIGCCAFAGIGFPASRAPALFAAVAAIGAAAALIAAYRTFGGPPRAEARDAEDAERLRAVLSTIDSALDTMPQGFALYNKDQKLTLANRRYAEMYGLAAEDLTPGMTMKEILEKRAKVGVFMGQDPARYITERVNAMETPASENGVERFSDGRIVRKTRSPMPDGGWLSVHEDITERQRADDKVAYLAHNDVLTGLFNRAVLLDRMEAALARARRSGRECAFLLVDLDNFKIVNDNYGHLLGDRLLQAVASRLQSVVREIDTVARIGGDEFAILQDCGENARESAGNLAKRLLEAMREPLDIDGFTISIHASVGIALAPSDAPDSAGLQRKADLALYQAKDGGRDCARFFSPEMDSILRVERAIEFDLRQALMADELELHYQAVANIKTMRTVGMEALVRWRHPTMGMVPPDRFIKIAERTGLISVLGEWVLDTACVEAMKWPPHISVAVNLSPAQFSDGRIVEIVRAALSKSGLPAARLTLEITESTLLEHTDDNLAILEQLRALGARIALDDFGTGYSSLSYLRSIPFDVVKIDRSFVVAMATSQRSESIVAAVVALSRSLNFTTVAEGIETPDQLRRVSAAGCVNVQGYLFARPVPAADLDFDMLDSHAGKRAA